MFAGAEVGPDQVRVTTTAGTATLAASYADTIETSAFRIGHGAAAAAFNFYGGLAFDRATTAGERALITEWLNLRAGL
jgi:hypothetical protein